MRLAAFAALFSFTLAAAACGKVGDPLPPVVRIPRAVDDLRAVQSGYRVLLSWTNPGQYVDNNAATDLSVVRILKDGAELTTLPVNGAGQMQSHEMDVSGMLDSDLTFSVQIDSQRGRVSARSQPVSIHVVDVPGAPEALTGVFDQLRILLKWEPPQHKPELANVYFVQRSDGANVAAVQTTEYSDADYELGKEYTYSVTANRAADTSIPGLGAASITVKAEDTTPPMTPSGLQLEPLGDGVLLQWQANTERDFKEYWLYRSDASEPIVKTPANAFRDPGYRAGLSYQLLAIDVYDNPSPRTEAVPGP